MNVTGWEILWLLIMETWCIIGGDLLPRTIRLDLLSFFACCMDFFGRICREREMGGNSQHGMEFFSNIIRDQIAIHNVHHNIKRCFFSPHSTKYFPTNHKKHHQIFPSNSSPRTNKARAVRLFT
jgi:hypothetical protein